MNNIKIKQTLTSFSCMLLLLAFCLPLHAQKTESKKKIVIITKKVDAEGNEIINKEILEGEAAEAYKLEESHDIDIEEHTDGKSILKIKIRKEEHGEGEHEIEMEVDSDVQEMEDENGNTFISIDNTDNSNMKVEKTVEIKDGVRTETIIKRQYLNSNKAFLGVALKKGGENGVLVDQVIEGSPAEKAGLKSGDIITHINKTPVQSLNELHKALSPLKVDDKAAITYQRAGKASTTTATLVKREG